LEDVCLKKHESQMWAEKEEENGEENGDGRKRGSGGVEDIKRIEEERKG